MSPLRGQKISKGVGRSESVRQKNDCRRIRPIYRPNLKKFIKKNIRALFSSFQNVQDQKNSMSTFDAMLPNVQGDNSRHLLPCTNIDEKKDAKAAIAVRHFLHFGSYRQK